MGAIKARFGIVIIFCSLLIAVSVKGWYWYTQLTDRIYASIQQQVGFALNAGQVKYDPVNNKIALKDITISALGLDVKAADLQLGIVTPGWRNIGRKTFPVTVKYASFTNTTLQVDSPESLLPLFELGNTFFHNGKMSLGQTSGLSNPELSFSSLDFHHQSDSSVDVSATGANGLSWVFTGVMDEESVFGKLVFEHQDIARFFSDSSYSGHFDAVFELEWSGLEPLQLSGELQGEAGGYQSEGFSFFWEGWHLSDVKVSNWQITDTANILALDKTRVELLSSNLLPLLSWLEKHPFQFSDMVMTHFQVRPDPERTDNFDFTDARFSLTEKKKSYHFMARPLSGGELSLIGSPDGEYRLALENVAPAVLGLLDITRIHNFADRRYNFSYNSQNGVGRLSFWQQGKAENYSLLERLLFNAEGFAELIFNDDPVGLLDLKTETGRQISAQLKTIHDMPFTYLSRLTDSSLKPYFEHISGRPGLSLNGEANLATLKKICELRPGLNWQLETSFSNSEDWPVIARSELEQTLANLGVDENASSSEEVRERLVEQLYLVTQKQKIPNVGLVKKEERIQQAEQWLVDSWPKNSGLIDQLLDDRKKDLTNHLAKNGLPAIPVVSSEQEHDLPRSWLSIK